MIDWLIVLSPSVTHQAHLGAPEPAAPITNQLSLRLVWAPPHEFSHGSCWAALLLFLFFFGALAATLCFCFVASGASIALCLPSVFLPGKKSITCPCSCFVVFLCPLNFQWFVCLFTFLPVELGFFFSVSLCLLIKTSIDTHPFSCPSPVDTDQHY